MIKIKNFLLSNYNDDEFMFKLLTGLKFVLISIVFTFSVLLFTYLLIKIDLIFFMANGYPGATEFQEAFYDYINSSLIDEVPYVLIAIIFIFVLGYQLAGIMIRPFRELGRYCADRMSDSASQYSPDYISDLKLLTSFSIFFFSHIDDAEKKQKLQKVEVPHGYTRIHRPVIEKNFFFNYIFIIVIFSLLASVGIFVINNAVREQIYQLSQKFLVNNSLVGSKGIRYFIEEQFSVSNIAVYFFLTMHIFTYCLFGLHLYGKISGPAFAIFATMRSFLKGNYHNRVHLIGHPYIREDCRKINKYLDFVQKKLT